MPGAIVEVADLLLVLHHVGRLASLLVLHGNVVLDGLKVLPMLGEEGGGGREEGGGPPGRGGPHMSVRTNKMDDSLSATSLYSGSYWLLLPSLYPFLSRSLSLCR